MGRYAKREHKAGKFWLGKRANSPAWCICWMEGRQLRRKSTGTWSGPLRVGGIRRRF